MRNFVSFVLNLKLKSFLQATALFNLYKKKIELYMLAGHVSDLGNLPDIYFTFKKRYNSANGFKPIIL